jgi:hypothetical protein
MDDHYKLTESKLLFQYAFYGIFKMNTNEQVLL